MIKEQGKMIWSVFKGKLFMFALAYIFILKLFLENIYEKQTF